MGERLAGEVINYIDEWCPRGKIEKLSFIGHSLGGIIIRAALPHLEKYKDKLNTYMSLSTPHLGCSYDTAFFVDKGLSFI